MWEGKGVECSQCHSVLVKEIPSSQELEQFYSTYNNSYNGSGGNLDRYAKTYFSLVKKYKSSGCLLDIGSSNSPFPNYAAESGFQVTVTDYSKPTDLSHDVKFIQGNLGEYLPEKLGFNQFEIVCAWAVIEHVPDPHLAIKNMVDLVQPGGYIFLTTPEIGTVLTNYSIGKSQWFYPPEHIFLISPIAVSKLFEKYKCEQLVQSRIEINTIRYMARCCIGIVEFLMGLPVKILLPKLWHSLRARRYQQYAGISLFVFRKL